MYDLGIVGAGPAGITAALTAAQHGLSVVVVDEQQRPGGQIFRQPPRARVSKVQSTLGYPWGQALVAQAEASDSISWRLGSTALGLLTAPTHADGHNLVVRGAHGLELLPVRTLLIATGAMDLPVPFPGWTLPGVMSAGGIQTLLKSQHALMAGRSVLTGGHPLLVVVAGMLLERGGEIGEIVLPHMNASWPNLIRTASTIPGHFGVVGHAGLVMGRLALARIRFSRGAIVSAARGDGRVEEVDIVPLGPANTMASHAAPRTVAADGLVLGYGFQPSTDLARQIGCSLTWDSAGGGWIVDSDDRQRTSVRGIYVAGEPTGVAGAEQARLEGRLAGLTIAADVCGRTEPIDRQVAQTQRALRPARRFSTSVQRLFEPPRETLANLAGPDSLVCRCEAITRRQVETTIDANPFISSTNALKLECRVGMGPCQGRYCELTAATVLAQRRGMSIKDVGPFNGQFPIRPATVDELSHISAPTVADPQSPVSALDIPGSAEGSAIASR
jgi:thioredoxin reductase